MENFLKTLRVMFIAGLLLCAPFSAMAGDLSGPPCPGGGGSNTVPEPSTLLLLAAGGGLMLVKKFREKK
jgi:hypothetical protein